MTDAVDLTYLAGFMDGAGLIGRRSQTSVGCIGLGQCDPSVVQLICKRYGASMRVREKGGNWRAFYMCELAGRYARAFLNDIKDALILKATDARAILDALDEKVMVHNEGPRGNKVVVQDEEGPRGNKVVVQDEEGPRGKKVMVHNEGPRGKKVMVHNEKWGERVTWEYTAGLFDAIGTIAMDTRNFVAVALTIGDGEVLEAIAKLTGLGHVIANDNKIRNFKLVGYSRDKVGAFLTRVLPLLRVKKTQAVLALEAMGLHGPPGPVMPQPAKDRLSVIQGLMKDENHKVFHVEPELSKVELSALRKKQNPAPHTALATAPTSATKGNEEGSEETPAKKAARKAREKRASARKIERTLTDNELVALRWMARENFKTLTELGRQYGISRRYASFLVGHCNMDDMSDIQDMADMLNNNQTV